MTSFEIIVLISVFLAVSGLGVGVYIMLNPTRTAADRVADFTQVEKAEPERTALLTRPRPARSSSMLGAGAAERSNRDDQSERARLRQAGFRSPSAFQTFKTIQTVLTVALPFLAWLAIRPHGMQALSTVIIVSACLGQFGPKYYIEYAAYKRRIALLRPFPDALDLLVSCVEAGLALDASLQRVGEEFEQVSSELSQEIKLVNAEMAAGVPRPEALRHLDERIGLQEFNSLVNVIIQADRYGTSIANALRAHSNLVRNKRILQAEEKAGKVAPKMTVVMILFLFPALFVVILGPAAVQIAKVLLPALQK